MGADYTTFTEVDPNSHIVVDSATQITFTDLSNNEDAYVYKATSGNVGDFTAKGSFKITDFGTSHHSVFIGYADEVDDWGYANMDNAAGVVMRWSGSGGSYQILKFESGSYTFSSQTHTFTTGTRYWWTFTRSGTTLTFKAYTDSGRTSQFGSTHTLTMTTATEYQYLYAVSSANIGANYPTDAIIYELEEATGLSASYDETYTETLTLSDSVVVTVPPKKILAKSAGRTTGRAFPLHGGV